MRGYATLCSLASLAILGVGFGFASRPVDVYGPPLDFVVSRYVDADGHDRIRIDASISKLLNCDLESGDSPPWIEFRDRDVGVPPPSALYRPDGIPAGSTHAKAGETIELRGYTAFVPAKMQDVGGTFIARVPCQLWEHDEVTGEKVWGCKIVASFGPVPVPMPGSIALDDAKVALMRAGAFKR